MNKDPQLTRDQLILQGDEHEEFRTGYDYSRIERKIAAQMHNDDLIEDILKAVKSLIKDSTIYPARVHIGFERRLEVAFNIYENWLSQQETRA